MTPPIRRLLGSIGVVVFMVAYIWAAIAIAERLPTNTAVQLVFFIVAGTAWGLPLFPLIAWAQRVPPRIPQRGSGMTKEER